MDKRKKLLILVDWFAPGYKAGGPIQSCVNICIALKNEYQIYVLTTDTDHGETMPYQGIESNKWVLNESLGAHIFYVKKTTLQANQLAAQIDFVNADFIYLNHLFSPYFVVYPLWLIYRNKIKGKMLVCPRGALYDSALSLKIYKKRPLLYLYRWMGMHKQITFHATNFREQKAIQQYFPGSQIVVADNLPSLTQTDLVICKKEIGKLNCIFVSRIVPIKNLLFLLQILQGIRQQVTLTIVGPIENEGYWQDCEKLINKMPENIVIKYEGPKQKSELAALIQQNHLFILPTTGENFGHAIFEALLAGRPVLISNQTPWLNLQTQHVGWDLPLSHKEIFAEAIQKMADADQEIFNQYAAAAWQYANNYISNTAHKEQYFNLFK